MWSRLFFLGDVPGEVAKVGRFRREKVGNLGAVVDKWATIGCVEGPDAMKWCALEQVVRHFPRKASNRERDEIWRRVDKVEWTRDP